ncbi:MAG: BatA domain-containing protein, partial [Gemmataceae bacterium]
MLAFVHLPWMLFGLAALAVPVLVHLLNRRRYDVVDWGAMRFLKVSETTRKRVLLEDILLMLLRMALLAALVVGLAGPFIDVRLPKGLAGRPPRDVVLIIDGSSSMGATGDDRTPAERARDWALKLIDELSPGDGVAVLLAREQPLAVVGELSPEHGRVRRLLGELPPPAGSCSVADALRRALALLGPSQKR